MSKSHTAETAWLRLLFNNTTWAGIGDAGGVQGSNAVGSLYVALHTADPGEAGNQSTSETAYTNYTRMAVARTTAGWTVSGTTPTQVANAAPITFPQCGATGASLTHFSVGKASGGGGEILYSGALSNGGLAVSNGVTPQFATGVLICTED